MPRRNLGTLEYRLVWLNGRGDGTAYIGGRHLLLSPPPQSCACKFPHTWLLRERLARFELAPSAWKADILAIKYYRRDYKNLIPSGRQLPEVDLNHRPIG